MKDFPSYPPSAATWPSLRPVRQPIKQLDIAVHAEAR
jgi:hypothetical protein